MELNVRMRGGLGNQMFIYGYALALRERYPDAVIRLDLREYRHYTRRAFELADFNLNERVEYISDGRMGYDLPMKLYHVYQRLYRDVKGRGPYGLSEALCRRGLVLCGTGCPLPETELPEKSYLYGYFQNAEVLLPIREKLIRAYSLPEGAMDAIPLHLREIPADSIAVSVRLGSDIVRSGWKLCTKEYYRAGVEMIRRSHPGGKILVFSDLPDRVREEAWFDDMADEIVYVKGLTPCQQMELLGLCSHFVISNSTFAWWGAFLGAGEEGIIAAPALWQGNIPTAQTAIALKNMVFPDP